MRLLILICFGCMAQLLPAQDWKKNYSLFMQQVEAQDYPAAMETGEKTMQLLEKAGQSTDTAYANLAYYMGYFHFSAQQYDKALAYGLKDIGVRKQLPPDEQYYSSLYMLAAYYGHLERFDEAALPMKEVVAHYEQVLDETDKRALAMRYQLATIYQNGGRIYEAEALYEKNYRIVRQNSKPTDSLYQATVNNIYLFYYNTGNFRKAEPFYTGALKELEKQYGGKYNNNYLAQQQGLVQFYVNGNMMPEAVSAYTEYMDILARLTEKNNEDYRSTLANYIDVCLAAPDYARAAKAYEEYLQLTEKHLGTQKDTAYITLLNTVGEFYINAGMYDKAEKTYRDFLKLVEAYFGKNTADHATALNNLAVVYEKQGRNAEAEKLYLETLRIKEKVYKKESAYYALTLVNLGVLYDNMGRYPEAGQLLEQAIQVYEKVYGGKNENYATALGNIASVYASGGKTAKARAYAEKAAGILKEQQGENSPAYIGALNNLSGMYSTMGEYARAVELAETAVRLSEKNLGPLHADLGTALYNLANLKTNLGLYADAEALLLRALDIEEKAVGRQHARYAVVLQSLAALYTETGRYAAAEKTYTGCEKLFRKVYGERHPEYATLLNNMAYFYAQLSDYKTAAAYIDRALVIQHDHFGNDHPHNVPLLSTRANISLAMGDARTAEQCYLEVVKTAEKHNGTRHPDYALALSNLGNFYRSMGNYEKALPLFDQSLDIFRGAYGPQHTQVANTLNSSGALYLSMATDAQKQEDLSRYAAMAIDRFKQAIRIDSTAFGADHSSLASRYNNLAEAYRLTNQPAPAEQYYLRAIAIEEKNRGADAADAAVTYHNLALLHAGKQDWKKAETYALTAVKRFEKQFGPASHAAANVTASLAYIYEMQGRDQEAFDQYRLAASINRDIVEKNFAFLSEHEKEQFLASVGLYRDMFGTFALKSGFKIPQVYENMYDQVLYDKGLLFRSSARLRQQVSVSSDTALVSLYNQWNNAKKSLATVYATPVTERAQDLPQLEERVNALEKQLVAATGMTDSQQLTWQDIRQALQPGQAAVEFTDFMYNDERKQMVYCALVIRHGSAQPVMIRLFDATELEKIIGKTGANDLAYINGIYGQRNAVSQQLYNLVWKHLEKELAGIKEVYYAPSGLLNKISFAAMAGENGSYLSEQYVLHTVTGTAVLAGKKPENFDPAAAQAAVYGGVNYNTGNTVGEVWKYLPGTLTEAEKINRLLAAARVKTSLYTGVAATEKLLKTQEGQQAPAILHIATHGFFYAGPGAVNEEIKTEVASVDFRGSSRGVQTFVENPNALMRSGIVLAGANAVWSEEAEQAGTGTEDGVLTAYEVSLLDLRHTQLTVLSACETGLGDIKGSEGVYGLQRAFRIAGSGFVIMSLWQVPDKETEMFMANFYSSLLEQQSIRRAFAETQALMRQQYDPYFWAAFVLVE